MARLEQQARLERTASDAVLQRRAFQKLHRDEGLVFVLADFVNGADVGMIQRGGRARFAPEAFQSLWVMRKFVGKEL